MEEKIRDVAVQLRALVEQSRETNPPLTDRALALLADAVEMAVTAAHTK